MLVRDPVPTDDLGVAAEDDPLRVGGTRCPEDLPRSTRRRKLYLWMLMIGISGVVITAAAGQVHPGVAHWLLWLVGTPTSFVILVIGATGLQRTKKLISEEVQAERTVSARQADAIAPTTFRSQYDRRRFVARYGPKWGNEAARLMHRRNGNFNIMLMCLGLLFLFGPFGEIHLPAVAEVLLGIVAVWAGVGVIALWRQINRAATQSLGTDIGWRKGHRPPRKAAAYESWCREHGLIPYAAV